MADDLPLASPKVAGRGPGRRFVKGQRSLSPGNPFAAQVMSLKRAIWKASASGRLERVVAKLARMAEAGDVAAAKVFLSYAVGQPTQHVQLEGVNENAPLVIVRDLGSNGAGRVLPATVTATVKPAS